MLRLLRNKSEIWETKVRYVLEFCLHVLVCWFYDSQDVFSLPKMLRPIHVKKDAKVLRRQWIRIAAAAIQEATAAAVGESDRTFGAPSVAQQARDLGNKGMLPCVLEFCLLCCVVYLDSAQFGQGGSRGHDDTEGSESHRRLKRPPPQHLVKVMEVSVCPLLRNKPVSWEARACYEHELYLHVLLCWFYDTMVNFSLNCCIQFISRRARAGPCQRNRSNYRPSSCYSW